MKVLVTGGAGYIGSTICSALEDHGHTPIILDSLVTGCELFTHGHIFYCGDIADPVVIDQIFHEHPDITHTIHCAAFISVPESVEKPFEYYQNNVAKSLELFRLLNEHGCKNIIFSSSASVYDDTASFLVIENSPLNPRSPYARTKHMMEMVLNDFCTAYGMCGIALRYFNPIGADPEMRSGPYVPYPSHVMGKLISVAQGKAPVFQITGVNWPTRDGSGIRDYIHVWDLAKAHVMAVERFAQIFQENEEGTYRIINLGTGCGVTVKELVRAFETVYLRTLNKVETDPRPGDVAGAYANADVAQRLLGWKAQFSIEQGIADALKWESRIKGARRHLLNN